MALTLGFTYDPQRQEVYLAVFSKNASRMEVYFYTAAQGAEEVLTKTSTQGADDVWRVMISREELIKAGIRTDAVYYGYRAWGPNWIYQNDWTKGSSKGFICDVDDQGNRFNPNKLLIDPYARELSHDPEVATIAIDPNVYVDDYYGGAYHNNRQRDTGNIGPKSIGLLVNQDGDYGIKPQRLLKDDIIYEVNLRGLSMQGAHIPQQEKGTFKGAAQQASYLKELGVTAVEFLPIHEFADGQNDDGDERGDNYWGYMTLNYFSPNRRYSSDKSPGGPTREFKEMVKAFHGEGIKVFLDVVYNHTGEGILRRKLTEEHPSTPVEVAEYIHKVGLSRSDDTLQDQDAACILSFTGLDNQSYYFLRDENKRYEGRGGCGGNLNYDQPVVKNLIIDSLQYWKQEMGVDGFRFDLAPILSVTGRNGNCQSTIDSTIFEDISNALPSRQRNFSEGIDLIAEPWGDGSGIDWTDKFPWDWSVWNKDFRDTLKTSFNKYGVSSLSIHEISKVLTGSKEFIGKKPWNSINYLVSHDDCNSLANIFSYNKFFHLTEAVIREDQISWDQGGNREEQTKVIRNAFTLLLLSPGVPMFTGGDELLRMIPPYSTGLGKMNMVGVDSPEVYMDFGKYHELQDDLAKGNEEGVQQLLTNNDDLYTFQFVKNLIEFRKKHECLRPADYFEGRVISPNGFADITWYREDSGEIKGDNWDESDFIAYRMNGEFEKVQNQADRVISIYIAYNRSPQSRHIIFPKNLPGKQWYRILDTDNTGGWMSQQGNFDGGKIQLGSTYVIHDRSVLVLVER